MQGVCMCGVWSLRRPPPPEEAVACQPRSRQGGPKRAACAHILHHQGQAQAVRGRGGGGVRYCWVVGWQRCWWGALWAAGSCVFSSAPGCCGCALQRMPGSMKCHGFTPCPFHFTEKKRCALGLPGAFRG